MLPGGREIFFSHSEKIALLGLYLVGMYRSNLMHLGFLLFFLMFFSYRKTARKFWWLLAAYCSTVLVVLYGFSIFATVSGELQDGLIYVGASSVASSRTVCQGVVLTQCGRG